MFEETANIDGSMFRRLTMKILYQVSYEHLNIIKSKVFNNIEVSWKAEKLFNLFNFISPLSHSLYFFTLSLSLTLFSISYYSFSYFLSSSPILFLLGLSFSLSVCLRSSYFLNSPFLSLPCYIFLIHASNRSSN